MSKKNDPVRVGALTQLKQAQKMIERGRAEMSAAQEKIALAQQLIDESSKVLRETWSGRGR